MITVDKVTLACLKSIGMRAFIEFYDMFKNQTTDDIVRFLQSEQNYQKKAIHTRISKAKRLIFSRDGANLRTALIYIAADERRVPQAVKDKAKRILEQVQS